MIYNFIDGVEIVRRLDDDHSINISSQLSRIPKWMFQALKKLNLLVGLVPAVHTTTIENGIAYLPEEIEELVAIEYNGTKLTRKDFPAKLSTSVQDLTATVITSPGVTVRGQVVSYTIDPNLNIELNFTSTRRFDHSSIIQAPSSSDYYVLLKGKIETNLDRGLIHIYYYKFPYEYNDDFGINVPLIPDNEEVVEYITLYIIANMLQRGYKHPVYELNSNNEFTNIALRLKKSKIPARNSANRWDADKFKNVLKVWNSAFYNKIANID